MTSSKSRRRRSRADDDQAATELLQAVRPADWDATTIEFTGASAVGLPPDQIYAEDGTADPYRRAIAMANREAQELASGTWDNVPEPARLHTLPPAGQPDDDDKTIARDMARGWPRLFEIRCAYPAATSDTPIPCGAIYTDDGALSFRALRRSAWAAGWHLDAHGRWACPDCGQANPDYRTLYPVILWDPEAAAARQDGDQIDEQVHRARVEHDLFRDVLDAARRGRHAGGVR